MYKIGQDWMLQHMASGRKVWESISWRKGVQPYRQIESANFPASSVQATWARERQSEQRVREVETFTPLVLSSTGAMGKAATVFISGWPQCSVRRGTSSTARQWDGSDADWALSCCDVPCASGEPGHLNTIQQLSPFNSLKVISIKRPMTIFNYLLNTLLISIVIYVCLWQCTSVLALIEKIFIPLTISAGEYFLPCTVSANLNCRQITSPYGSELTNILRPEQGWFS